MKKSLKNLKMAHGKLENSYAVSTLDQIWGDTGTSGFYDTLDETIYKQKLDEMNKSDLQAHAIRAGLIPVDNRETLVNRLMREFRIHASSYRVTKPPVSTVKNLKNVENILSEGR